MRYCQTWCTGGGGVMINEINYFNRETLRVTVVYLFFYFTETQLPIMRVYYLENKNSINMLQTVDTDSCPVYRPFTSKASVRMTGHGNWIWWMILTCP